MSRLLSHAKACGMCGTWGMLVCMSCELQLSVHPVVTIA